MNDDIEAQAIKLATAQSPLTNMQVADLLAEVERLKDAAAFDKAIFAGERTMRQDAITRALDAERERDELRKAMKRIANTQMNLENCRRVARAALEAKPAP